jgi:hypothetical protein
MRRRSLHRQETKRPPRYIRMRCFLLECENLSRGIGSIARPAARDCGRQPAWMMAESTRHLAKAHFPLKAILAWNEGADD